VILEAKQLTKRFGELAAVNNLSFEVETGEIFGIAGPNGAGKTTLFNVISGVYSGAGEIIFEGQQIDGLRSHQICHKGLARTFQVPAVFSSMTLYDNIRVGAYFGRDGQDDQDEEKFIRDTLDYVGLKGKEKVTAKHLSLFDKKMTMIAMALATKPRLLMLDEPIGGFSTVHFHRTARVGRRSTRQEATHVSTRA